MKTLFESGKALKFYEEDVYSEGCIPNSGGSMEVDIEFSSSSSLADLLKQIKDYYGVDDDALELNACDENGRIDISIMEDDDSNQATERQRSLWKEGKQRLWYSNYSYNIQKVTYEDVSLI